MTTILPKVSGAYVLKGPSYWSFKSLGNSSIVLLAKLHICFEACINMMTFRHLCSMIHVLCIWFTTDVEGIPQIWYIAPLEWCRQPVAQIGGRQVFTAHKNKCIHNLCMPCGFPAFSDAYSHSDHIRCRWHTYPTNLTMVILIMQKTWRPPIWAPCQVKMAQVPGSLLHIFWLTKSLFELVTSSRIKCSRYNPWVWQFFSSSVLYFSPASFYFGYSSLVFK